MLLQTSSAAPPDVHPPAWPALSTAQDYVTHSSRKTIKRLSLLFFWGPLLNRPGLLLHPTNCMTVTCGSCRHVAAILVTPQRWAYPSKWTEGINIAERHKENKVWMIISEIRYYNHHQDQKLFFSLLPNARIFVSFNRIWCFCTRLWSAFLFHVQQSLSSAPQQSGLRAAISRSQYKNTKTELAKQPQTQTDMRRADSSHRDTFVHSELGIIPDDKKEILLLFEPDIWISAGWPPDMLLYVGYPESEGTQKTTLVVMKLSCLQCLDHEHSSPERQWAQTLGFVVTCWGKKDARMNK